jgi:hypothetical protein
LHTEQINTWWESTGKYLPETNQLFDLLNPEQIKQLLKNKIEIPDTKIYIGDAGLWEGLMTSYYNQQEANLFQTAASTQASVAIAEAEADSYYSDDIVATATALTGGGSGIQDVTQMGVIPVTNLLQWLMRTGVGQRAIGPVLTAARQAGTAIGSRWQNVPAGVRGVLRDAGLVSGYEIVIDREPDDLINTYLPYIPGISSGTGGTTAMAPFIGTGTTALDVLNVSDDLDSLIGQVFRIGDETKTIVKAWRAPKFTGVLYLRFMDGSAAVQKKSGVWKLFRYKKPLVMYAGGAKDLRTLLKIDNAVEKQSKKIAKLLRNRGKIVRSKTEKA